MRPQIVNVINFIRGVEPRDPGLDLLEPVENQIRLLKEYSLPGTFLIQYDALIQEKFTSLLISKLDEKYEVGGWFEIVQPLAEKAGLLWRGRPGFPWDWHANVGFSLGYTPREREMLVDAYMDEFFKVFGRYPASVGAWIIDAHTLGYMADKYGIEASCNCRDQWGTDGYSLWGGYYNQAYYPSRLNVFSPAQAVGKQIPVPVFRMLGSDPIYQYDAGLVNGDTYTPSGHQPVITLEPVYPDAGGSAEWVDWYFKENFNGICLSFGYTQVGQENSFGWPLMKEGLSYQIQLLAQKVQTGEVRVETLGSTGRWFRSTYNTTPASAVAALSDWKGRGSKSIWFSNKNYRINFMQQGSSIWIRDIHKFDDCYEETYLYDTCKSECFVYDNLPVIDGNRWSGGITRAGMYPVEVLSDGSTRHLEIDGEINIEEKEEGRLSLSWTLKRLGVLNVDCREKGIYISCKRLNEGVNWALLMMWGEKVRVPVASVNAKVIDYRHNNSKYCINAEEGNFAEGSAENTILLNPVKDTLLIGF